MDKIRLSIDSHPHDFARLYDWGPGFHSMSEKVAFLGDRFLTLFLISERPYELSVQGDLILKNYDDTGDVRMRFYDIHWSDAANQLGHGSGILKLVNPEFPEAPSVFELTLGVFSYAPKLTTDERCLELHTDGATQRPGLAEMLSQERMHAASMEQ